MSSVSSHVASRQLVVALHGSHGSPADLLQLRHAIDRICLPVDRVTEYCVPGVVQRRGTDAGIATCTEKLAGPIKDAVSKFCDAHSRRVCRRDDQRSPSRITFVGHSFGGVLARSVLGQLERDGVLANATSCGVRLDRVVTIASPHLGVGLHSLRFQKIVNTAATVARSTTYRDLLLQTPALAQLAADLDVQRATSRFNRRIAVTPTGDCLVPAASALIAPVLHAEVQQRVAEGQSMFLPTCDTSQATVPMQPPPQDVARWRAAASAVDPETAGQLALMASQIECGGTWSPFIVPFPRLWAPASHRAVVGKPPYDKVPRFRLAQVDAVAQLVAPTKW